VIAERFFDEAGGMQLVIHAPFGSRINKAWGLALRKRFCRSFNFELQAAATEDGIVLSLGPQHSFPLETVFDFLHPDSVKEVLIQALLDAPMFGTRWRWNGTVSLAIPRYRGGRKVPPQIQRMEADDLLAAVFPDAAACLENIPGDREIPSHPLAEQTIHDCLYSVMDLDGLIGVLGRLKSGEIRALARDLPEPSPLASEILNARPYAFLDDAPLEERRTQAVHTRRAFEPSSADDLGALDPAAIERVREEAWPEVQSADELHDALMTTGYLIEGGAAEETAPWLGFMAELTVAGRAQRVNLATGDGRYWVAMERLGEFLSIHPSAKVGVPAPPGPSREDSLREVLRGRLDVVGPATAAELADSIRVSVPDVDGVLAALEAEGTILRGRFRQGAQELEWCHRRLLARIHRYTLERLRAEIEPVSAADFVRFLLVWQRVNPEDRVTGLEGLAAVIEQLDGFEVPAGAWEPDVLAARCNEYDPTLLDMLSLTGRVAWGRLDGSAARPVGENGTGVVRGGPRPIRSTPVALSIRENMGSWLALTPGERPTVSSYARDVLEVLERRGASFFGELVSGTKLLATQVEQALAELAAGGLVTSDSFTGLRALITPSEKRKPMLGSAAKRHRTVPFGIESAGRWSLLRAGSEQGAGSGEQGAGVRGQGSGGAVEAELLAKTLLRRYGVVFKKLLTRESVMLPWRDLLQIYRRLEARGEIRGGRFVAGMQGEQFALADAIPRLRAVRRAGKEQQDELMVISAADPLNLSGIILPGERITAHATSRIAIRHGLPIAVRERGEIRWLAEIDPSERLEIERALARKRISPALRAYLGMVG
jgi:ATP-dependent helicase Lhr and Lhr-like helicase